MDELDAAMNRKELRLRRVEARWPHWPRSGTFRAYRLAELAGEHPDVIEAYLAQADRDELAELAGDALALIALTQPSDN